MPVTSALMYARTSSSAITPVSLAYAGEPRIGRPADWNGSGHATPSNDAGPARIDVTHHGPYKVTGDVAIYDAEGHLRRQGGVCTSVAAAARATSRSATSLTV